MVFLVPRLLSVLVLGVAPLPTAIAGTQYDSGPIAPAAVLGCKRGAPYYRVVDGVVPEGLTLRAGGSLTGVPKHAGKYEMTLELDNGCGRSRLTARLAVTGRPFLAAFDTDVELTSDKPSAVIRIYSNQQDLAYSVSSSEPWLTVKPLLARTPHSGEALAADLLTIELNQQALEAEGPKPKRSAVVQLSCFRCKGTSVRVQFQ
jgi:hypothetical protein